MSFFDKASRSIENAADFVSVHPKTSMVIAAVVALALVWLLR